MPINASAFRISFDISYINLTLININATNVFPNIRSSIVKPTPFQKILNFLRTLRSCFHSKMNRHTIYTNLHAYIHIPDAYVSKVYHVFYSMLYDTHNIVKSTFKRWTLHNCIKFWYSFERTNEVSTNVWTYFIEQLLALNEFF